MPYPPLGAQLIVFGPPAGAPDTGAAALDAVRNAGFGAVEGGVQLGGDDPEAYRALLAERGLAVAALHGGLDLDPAETLSRMELFGTRDLCISGVGGYGRHDAARFRADVAHLNEMGRLFAARGMALHYHNHAYEFSGLDGGLSGMEILLEDMDRQAVDLCLDVAWVHVAGHDPAIFLRRNAELIGYVHLKDYVGDRHWVALGNGVVPLESVMRALERLPRVRWAVYEQDTSDRPPAESCAISYQYLSLTFGYGASA